MKAQRPYQLRVLLLSGAFLLVLGGWDYYQQQNIPLAAVYVFAGVISVSALRNPKYSNRDLQLFSGCMNGALFLVNAVVLYKAGKEGLPYAWFAAALVSFWSGYRGWKKPDSAAQ